MPSTPPLVAKHLPPHSPPSATSSPLPKRTKVASAMATYPSTDPLATKPGARTLPDDTGAAHLHNTAETLSASQEASVRSMTAPLQVKLLSETAKPPTRGSKFAAGYDLYCSKTTTIPARGKALVPTDISVAIPPGTYGRVAPRSGLAAKHGIATGAGVIDYDYRGAVFVLLFNHEDKDFEIAQGDRCAQLVLERIVNPDVVVVQELEGTERGAGGFGSTGGFGATAAGGAATT